MKLFNEMLKTLKENKSVFLILFLILLFGIYLRAYHMDYPVVGYHNWKETHYLTEARNFARDGFFEHGFFVPANDYPTLEGDPSGAHADTFPITSILVAVFFKIFGTELWAARLIGVLFSLGTILMMFLVVRRLFKREDLAIISAFFTAILPLFVFFSHNVQLVNPGIFFMLTGAYFYLRWRENNILTELILSSIFLTLAILTKYPFLVIIIPILLTFPFKRLKKVKTYFSIIPLLLVPIWFLYSRTVVARTGKGAVDLSLINFSVLLTSSWWNSFQAYIIDNYTSIAFLFSLIGLLLIILLYKNGKLGEKFTLSYALATLIFVFIMSEKLGGHSYHQFPIAPFFIIAMSYFVVVISTNFANLATTSITDKEIKDRNFKIMKYLAITILLILVLYSPFNYPWDSAIDAKNRQFNTQFYGLDVAGEYIKEHSDPDERMFFSGGQTFGVLWHADRKGYYPIQDVEKIKKGESLGVEWIFIHSTGLQRTQTSGSWSYIKENYELKQLGFLKTGQGDQLSYLLLKKGGTFDDSKLNELIQNKLIHSKNYETTQGDVKFYYINFE